MHPDPTLPAHVVVPVVFAAALVGSVVGFAFSALAGAAVGMVSASPAATVAVLLVSSIAIQTYSVWSLREAIVWRRVMPFAAGGLLTVPLGVLLLAHASVAGYSVFIGVLVLALVGYRLGCAGTREAIRSNRWDALVGAVGGITGGLAAFPGAPVAAWCAERGWSKEEQRGVYQPYILLMQLVALGCLGCGPDERMLVGALPYAPVALAGAVIGLAFFRRLSTAQFNRFLTALLAAAGAILVVRGCVGLA